ncbi:MAG: glycoside hydrolase family 125 protein [Ignavibacteriaceae bacterium]
MTKESFTNKRPLLKNRKFNSTSVEEFIQTCKNQIADKEIFRLFENCFPNALDTTITYSLHEGIPDTFIITGDIDAMWLRDSTAQVWSYLRFIKNDQALRNLILGVINRQVKCLNIDPYANAFSPEPVDTPWKNDLTEMKPKVYERKWELDSLCYPFRLMNEYYKLTGDTSFINENLKNAAEKILIVLKEQRGEKEKSSYKFQRVTAVATDTLPLGGYGNPSKPCGLINSAFRPSDDACTFSFHIPSNLFAAKVFMEFSEIQEIKNYLKKIPDQLRKISEEILEAIYLHAIEDHMEFGKIYPYEIDGFGNKLFMDDANIPSLLSLPYLGITKTDDPVYSATRKFLLSDKNPYYFEGEFAEGIGSPHSGIKKVWHLHLITRALTSDDDDEIVHCLTAIKRTHAGTGFMHEAFNVNNPDDFSRSWFAWANSMFGELIADLLDRRPYILSNRF